jgi:hypothetical protein
MAMKSEFQILQETDFVEAVAGALVPRLADIISTSEAGHCLRVSDLSVEVATTTATKLRACGIGAQIHVLAGSDGVASSTGSDLLISSTKLVELRNPLPDGSLRPPLLVFLPSSLRTSAEDSFSVATFAQVPVADIYERLVTQLLSEVPPTLAESVQAVLGEINQVKWPWGEPAAQARYLLTAAKNGIDSESLGAALYEVGLVPDLRLFEDPSTLRGQLRRNIDCVQKLTDSVLSTRSRVLGLKLDNDSVRSLTQFLTTTGVDQPIVWTRRIITDHERTNLSFDQWTFDADATPDKVSITEIKTDLPVVPEDEQNLELQQLIGRPVLVLEKRKKIKISFCIDPQPAQVKGLDSFTVELVSEDGSARVMSKPVSASSKRTKKLSTTLSKIDQQEPEEGWYIIRVLAWTKEGHPVPVTGDDETQEEHREKPNESEMFYIKPTGVEPPPPPQRAIQREPSLEHATVKLQLSAIQSSLAPGSVEMERVNWIQESGSRKTSVEGLEVRFTRQGTVHIPVAPLLGELEKKILANPDQLCTWRLEFIRGDDGEYTEEATEWPETASVASFRAARARYFAAVQKDESRLVTQGTDVASLHDACAEYAEAYRDLLLDFRQIIERNGQGDQGGMIRRLQAMLSIDTVRIIITDMEGNRREAVLLGPTHPLRALWLVTWSLVARHWIQALSNAGAVEHIPSVRQSLLTDLVPLNSPMVLPLTDGRIVTAVDTLNPFWSLYAPPAEIDPRGLLGEVCNALGLPEPGIGGSTITGSTIAAKLHRYLIQHPYIRTLTINAFNPGRAKVLADAIAELQKQDVLKQIRYDIRLFVPSSDAPGIAEELDMLISSGGPTSAEHLDAFSTPSGNHLFPKLNVAVHPTMEFHQQPRDYRAHITFLFDLFPAEEVGAEEAFEKDVSTPVYGLVQDQTIRYTDDAGGVVWQRQPRHGQAKTIEGGERLAELLSELPRLISGATAVAATDVAVFDHRPVIKLSLTKEQRQLIHHVHDVSDWVITIDRNIGIEFYDHGGGSDRPEYLIDYTPSGMPTSGHRLFITSRSIMELESMVRPVLEMPQYDLNLDSGRQAVEIIEQLRSLSGRLALKLISSSMNDRAEAMGLALARKYLSYQGILSNQIVVPLDSHLELFRSAQTQSAAIAEEVTLCRTDLALFDLNPTTRTIRCNLVEVKCYGQASGMGGLRERIRKQIEESERALQQHFDPTVKSPDRPDRVMKTQELATLLRFYLDRALRYEIFATDGAEEARRLLDDLETGYTIEFTRSALVFDFAKEGTEAAETEFGIEFHRIGIDLIKALLEQTERTEESISVESIAITESASIPRLETAAFLSPRHERSATWGGGISTTKVNQTGRAIGEEHGELMGHREPISEEEASPVDSTSASEESDPTLLVEDDGAVPTEEKEPITAARSKDASVSRDILSTTSSSGSSHEGGPRYDIMLGVQDASPQYGILGEYAGRRVALDLNQTHTISLFGVQGGGKSYTLGTIIEMATLPIPSINLLPSPLATVVFHYSPTQDYEPEFTSMVRGNSADDQVAMLRERYGAEPKALEDVLILAPEAKVDRRREEYPDVEVLPLSFASSELQVAHWKFLMGAVGNKSVYLEQIKGVMKSQRDSLTLDGILHGVEQSSMAERLKEMARTRLQFAADYIDDSRRLKDEIRPGRLIIVDLRDEFIEKSEALGLFVVLLQIISEATYLEQQFNKLVVFDEAHKYIESPDLTMGLIEVVREMRHKGTSILIASQDPISVPISLIELSSQIILHRFNSPKWLKHIQSSNAALATLTSAQMSQLDTGEAYIWSMKASDSEFTSKALKIRCRPRATDHGGGTKTAV